MSLNFLYSFVEFCEETNENIMLQKSQVSSYLITEFPIQPKVPLVVSLGIRA